MTFDAEYSTFTKQTYPNLEEVSCTQEESPKTATRNVPIFDVQARIVKDDRYPRGRATESLSNVGVSLFFRLFVRLPSIWIDNKPMQSKTEAT